MVPFEISVSNDATNFEIIFASDIESSQESYVFISIQVEGMLLASAFVANESVNIDDVLKVVVNHAHIKGVQIFKYSKLFSAMLECYNEKEIQLEKKEGKVLKHSRPHIVIRACYEVFKRELQR